MNRLPSIGFVLGFAFTAVFCQTPSRADSGGSGPVPAGHGLYWYKGNTHTHTWWSDGDSPPDLVVKWYREHGYQFLSLSDHNVLSESERWETPKGKQLKSIEIYTKAFGPEWIATREKDGQTQYRLKTLVELKKQFEAPGRFLMIQGEEITGKLEKRPVHVNAINLRTVIPPQEGATVTEQIQKDLDAVREQRLKVGRPMLAHVNHPNFGWGVTADDMAAIREQNFFEIHNGHSGVNNYGDENRPSAERMWDIILTKRLAELHMPVMYGVATDDAHCYTKWGVGNPNPGRAWVMVRAAELAPDPIVAAMERGDFYPTTGVVLKEIHFEKGALTIEIDARAGVSYTTQFIGTLDGYDPKPANRYDDPRGFLVNKYSETIGQVLSEVSGPHASYKLTGKEIYVRAKVISTAKHPNPYKEGDVEVAWVQPVTPAARAASPRP